MEQFPVELLFREVFVPLCFAKGGSVDWNGAMYGIKLGLRLNEDCIVQSECSLSNTIEPQRKHLEQVSVPSVFFQIMIRRRPNVN